MKVWFKYEYGYINMDDFNLYLTNSGNWSEIEELEEKTNRSEKFNRRNRLKKLSVMIVVGGVAAYNYLKSDLGLGYKIPLSKISNIEFDEEETIVSFIDGDGNKSYETLIKLEDKGKAFLRGKFN